MATEMPPLLNLFATESKGFTYDKSMLAYMRFVISESAETDRIALAKCLAEMKYARFLKTVYWAVIRGHILGTQPKCQRCRLKDTVHIHHRNYRIHGQEHDNIDSLVGLCGACHQRQHGMLEDLKQDVREYQAAIPSQGSNQGSLTHISNFILSVQNLLDGEPERS